jgi:cellulose synthase/poly-beta-1,6-N-acetylglucosamine synthase-like glycosyltransferase
MPVVMLLFAVVKCVKDWSYNKMVARVPVIIPFYKARAKLEKCVEHLRRQTYPNVEIFVRDNSDDNILLRAEVAIRRAVSKPRL